MDRRQLLFGMTVLALGSSKLSSLLQAQIPETAGWLPETSSSRASDHERAGLSRGLIKTSVEEITFAGTTAADGTQTPEQKSWSTTEYDVEGRIMATRARDSDGSEWVTRNTYDASGHLLKAAWGKQGEPTSETVYSYDDQGRVLSITYSSTPDNPVTFRYDERGRKTKVQVPVRKITCRTPPSRVPPSRLPTRHRTCLAAAALPPFTTNTTDQPRSRFVTRRAKW